VEPGYGPVVEELVEVALDVEEPSVGELGRRREVAGQPLVLRAARTERLVRVEHREVDAGAVEREVGLVARLRVGAVSVRGAGTVVLVVAEGREKCRPLHRRRIRAEQPRRVVLVETGITRQTVGDRRALRSGWSPATSWRCPSRRRAAAHVSTASRCRVAGDEEQLWKFPVAAVG
jgi:hypothetical protein